MSPTPFPPAPRPRRRVVPFLVAGILLSGLWGLSALTPLAAPKTPAAEYERHIAAHYTWHTQALYDAEAGIAEAQARLRPSAGAHRIVDTTPDDPTWGVLLGAPPDGPLAERGLPGYTRVASAYTAFTSTVLLRHATHAGTGAVLRWGDAQGTGVPRRNTTHGAPIYVLTARGSVEHTSHTVEVEAIHEAPPTVPAALYAGGPLRIASPQTYLDGMDRCGTQHQVGVQTPETMPLALPAGLTLSGTVPVRGHSLALQIPHMVETLKPWAIAFEGMRTCAEAPIMYEDTHVTQGHLADDPSGCGLLLIEGDLEIDGTFDWHGPVLITGDLRLTDASRTHVTGGVVVGGAVTIAAGAETTIHYCSTAIAQSTHRLPLRILSWRTILPAT